jgi:hypothetical protein
VNTTSTRARPIVFPCSSTITRASGSTWARRIAARACSAFARWIAGRLAQSFCAASAAAMAASTSISPLSGTVQMVRPVEGFVTLILSAPAAGTNCPLM